MQILLAEDNSRLADLTRQYLVNEGFQVDIAHDGQEALDKFDINTYDLVLLDVLMPEKNGFEVASSIRQTDQMTPILLLTALGDITDKTKGFQAGVDDYIVKPFDFGELTLRVHALIRRGKRADPLVLSSGKLSLNPIMHSATYGDTRLDLTAREFALLEYLLRNQGRVIPKTELLEHVWDMNY